MADEIVDFAEKPIVSCGLLNWVEDSPYRRVEHIRVTNNGSCPWNVFGLELPDLIARWQVGRVRICYSRFGCHLEAYGRVSDTNGRSVCRTKGNGVSKKAKTPRADLEKYIEKNSKFMPTWRILAGFEAQLVALG